MSTHEFTPDQNEIREGTERFSQTSRAADDRAYYELLLEEIRRPINGTHEASALVGALNKGPSRDWALI